MAALPGIVAKLLAERGAGARQARLHGAHGAADDLGHLRFGQALEVEQNHGPGVLGEAHQRALDLPGDDLPEPVQLDVSQEPVLLSGAERPRIDGVEAADGRVVALAAVLADERVAEDPEEPRFEPSSRPRGRPSYPMQRPAERIVPWPPRPKIDRTESSAPAMTWRRDRARFALPPPVAGSTSRGSLEDRPVKTCATISRVRVRGPPRPGAGPASAGASRFWRAVLARSPGRPRSVG